MKRYSGKEQEARRALGEQEAARVRCLLASRSEYVIGIDEVGMGAIAGPIAVGAVVTKVDWGNEHVKDSKKYASSRNATAHEKRILALDSIIKPQALYYTHTLMESQQVDKMGIQDAWHRCLWLVSKKCLERYPNAVVVVDGVTAGSVPTPNVMAIPKGDRLVPAVSAASVLAKVNRDRVMMMLGRTYPEYGFEEHKGYGTEQHMVALEKHGPCPIHRQSYDPIRKAEAAWQQTKRQKTAMPA